MAWLRVDDGFPEHAKLLALKRGQRWTWLEVLAYCARQSNGGYVPAGISETMKWVTPAFLARCLEVGLLDEGEDGYTVHDWEVYNPKDPSGAQRQLRYRNRHRNDEVTGTVTETPLRKVTPPARAGARGPSRPLNKEPSLPSNGSREGKEGLKIGEVLKAVDAA